MRSKAQLTTVTSRPGWFTREEMVDRYAARSGRDLSRLSYYEVFALFKIAVVIQQIYYRFVKGQTDDPRFAAFGERVSYLAQRLAARSPRAGETMSAGKWSAFSARSKSVIGEARARHRG